MFKKTVRPYLLLTFLLAIPAARAATIFNFDNDAVGTSTGFTDTVNGISATFSSSGDPGGFAVEQTIFQTLTGNVLGDPGPALQLGLTLNITFSSALSAIDLLFATGDFGTPSPLTLDAYNGTTLVGSVSQTGTVLSLFPEGEIAFSGAAFNSVVLSSTAPTFAIDNVQVAQAPEPGSATMLALGLLFAGVSAVRRRRAAR